MKGQSSYPNQLLRGWRQGGLTPQPTLWYRYWRQVFQVTMCAIWKVRVFNRHYEPAEGSAVYICNHQSFLDPILMSFALRRPMNYMARETLFRFPLFSRIIRSVNVFPVRRATADTAALKEAMRRLKSGGQMMMFPEGTRTADGRIGEFLPGVSLLARRAARWTVPVLIDGAFEAWPRSQALPRPGSIVVQYAPPITQEQAGTMSPRDFVQHVRRILITMQGEVRRRVGRPTIAYE